MRKLALAPRYEAPKRFAHPRYSPAPRSFRVPGEHGNAQDDLTLYPILGFGVQVKPTERLTWYAEGTIAGGFTMHDTGDSALLVYPSTGLSLKFGE